MVISLATGRGILFGLDDFQRPKMTSESEALADAIMNLLLMRKGQLPSMPHIGIDINKYLYTFEDTMDINNILTEIRQQCAEIIPNLDTDNIHAAVTDINGVDTLMLVFPILDSGGSMVVGLSKSKDGLVFDYKFDEENLLML